MTVSGMGRSSLVCRFYHDRNVLFRAMFGGSRARAQQRSEFTIRRLRALQLLILSPRAGMAAGTPVPTGVGRDRRVGVRAHEARPELGHRYRLNSASREPPQSPRTRTRDPAPPGLPPSHILLPLRGRLPT